ncbi:hypothetical protein TREES_T100007913 [Tupaia chinensis]|uniref:Uncharacterized protein n=1 Tax=Tupaia chinensis TaxID=246437 RepID=L9JCB6_TUPCH|nr:hypothetical protein TREES_T100007913 [Tupaia chinensis]
MHRLGLRAGSRHQGGAARLASPLLARALPLPTLRALNATIQRRHGFLPEDVGAACLPKRERRNKPRHARGEQEQGGQRTPWSSWGFLGAGREESPKGESAVQSQARREQILV